MPGAVSYLEWIGLFLGAAVAGVLCGIAFVRWRLVRRVKSEIGAEKILLVTTARLAPLAEDGNPARRTNTGILMLLKNGLYFHSWLGQKEFFVSGPAITYIGVADKACGNAMVRPAVVLKFLNSLGKEDGVYLRLLSPDQWVGAIKTHLIARPV
jgi:hypothetical protein